MTDNICQGYLALYNNQIVHRDIKPQNILITYDNNKNFESAKITDFGISRLLNEEKNGMCCNIAGTPEYMAPEIAANILKDSDYNHQVDMWSIGCLLYRCIAGHVSCFLSNNLSVNPHALQSYISMNELIHLI